MWISIIKTQLCLLVINLDSILIKNMSNIYISHNRNLDRVLIQTLDKLPTLWNCECKLNVSFTNFSLQFVYIHHSYSLHCCIIRKSNEWCIYQNRMQSFFYFCHVWKGVRHNQIELWTVWGRVKVWERCCFFFWKWFIGVVSILRVLMRKVHWPTHTHSTHIHCKFNAFTLTLPLALFLFL